MTLLEYLEVQQWLRVNVIKMVFRERGLSLEAVLLLLDDETGVCSMVQ